MLDLNGLFLAGRGFEQDLDRGLPPALHVSIPKTVLRHILMHQRVLGLILVHHARKFASIRMQAPARRLRSLSAILTGCHAPGRCRMCSSTVNGGVPNMLS